MSTCRSRVLFEEDGLWVKTSMIMKLDDDDRQDMVVLKGLLVVHGRTEDSPEKDCF